MTVYNYKDAEKYLKSHASGGVICSFANETYLAYNISMAYNFFNTDKKNKNEVCK